MKVYRSFDAIPYSKMTCVTIGTFDGIHQGHQRIIETLTLESQRLGCRSVVMTFDPHPQTVVRSKQPIGILTTLEEKVFLLKRLKLDGLLIVPFTAEFADMDPSSFVEQIVTKVGVRCFYLGHNHAFGKNRKGNEDLLRRMGRKLDFLVTEIPQVLVDGTHVSSTGIRHLLLEGRVREANRYLGRPYSMEGFVKRGRSLGRTIGFPTANLSGFSMGKLLPKDGVYAVCAILGKESIFGMANVGFNPTVRGSVRQVEIHLFQEVGSLYGRKLRIHFIERIRDEKQFDSVQKLGEQLKEDRVQVLSILENDIRR